MRECFRAERMKYRRTSIKGMTVGMPLVTVVLAAWLTHVYFAVDSYNWWYIGILPGFLTLYCCMSQEKEKKIRNPRINASMVWLDRNFEYVLLIRLAI